MRQVFGRFQGRKSAQWLLAATNIGPATGAFDLHARQLTRDIRGGGAQRLQLERVQQNLHLAVHPAHAVDRAHTAHRQQQLADVVFDEPGNGLVVHLVGADRVGQHRATGQLDLVDDGFLQVRRQIATHLGHGRTHIVQRLLGVLLDAELGGDGDHTVLHLGVDVLEALQRGQRRFRCGAGHIVFQLVGRRAGQAGHDGDVGHVQVGEVLHLHRLERKHARQRQHDEQHHGRDRVLD